MSCCGRVSPGYGALHPSPAPAADHPAQRRTSVEFEYLGSTALTVTGPASGRRYRFEGRGARLVVDPRDRPGLSRVPRLRQTGY